MPRWMWRGALGAFGLIVGALLVGGAALSLGAADPPVAGPLILDYNIETGSMWLAGAGSQVLLRPFLIDPRPALTVEVTAALDGPPDAAHGVWLQPCGRADRLIVALDGEGYVAVFTYPADSAPRWTWFLHARPGPEANRVRVDVDAQAFTVRVNDEIVVGDLAAGIALPARGMCAMGVYAATGAEGGAHVQFVRLRAWASDR